MFILLIEESNEGVSMKEIIVDKNEAGQRLDKLLTKYLNKAPKSFIYKMLRKKNITLNGKKATGNEKLELKDEIKLFLSDDTISNFSEVKVPDIQSHLDILYEDDHILCINKPSGMLSQKAKDEDVSVVEHVIAYLLEMNQLTKQDLVSFKPSICNRLDRNTSGIILAGKTLAGLQEMAERIRSHAVDKYYRCIVKGVIKEKKEIKGYLVKNEKTNKVTIHQDQKEGSDLICTEYFPLATNGNFTYLEVRLITGRSHQIRAHLSSIGHAIAGDFKYGDKENNNYFKSKYGCKDQLLHAYRLEFPKIEGALSALSDKVLIAPLPAIFQRVLEGEHLGGAK